MRITSYAQNFEDVMLFRAFRNVERGFYIDVGAFDPEYDSVSKCFYDRGWRGIHVEANSEYADRLKVYRPDELVIHAAVSDSPGILDFYQIPHTGLSSVIGTVADIAARHGWVSTKTSVASVTLDHVFDQAKSKEIHWLKIDVEGAERAALSGWNTSLFRPWIVLIEAIAPHTRDNSHEEWDHLIVDKGYEFAYFDGINRYYVSLDHIDLLQYFEYGPCMWDEFQFADSNPIVQPLVARFNQERSDLDSQFQRDIGTLGLALDEAKKAEQAAQDAMSIMKVELAASGHEIELANTRLQDLQNQVSSWRARTEKIELEIERAVATIAATEARCQIEQDRAGQLATALQNRDRDHEATLARLAEANDIIGTLCSQREAERAHHQAKHAHQAADLDRMRAQHDADVERMRAISLDRHLLAKEILAASANGPWRILAIFVPAMRRLSTLAEFSFDRVARSDDDLALHVWMAKDLSLRALLSLPDEFFVQQTYRSLLGRDVDRDGLAHHLALIKSGISRMELIAGIRQSDEGLAYTPRIAELDKSLKRYLRSRQSLPARVRTLARHITALRKAQPRRQACVGIEIFALNDIAFVISVYQLILGRDPDRIGLIRHVAALREGESKIGLMDNLARSPEAAAVGTLPPKIRRTLKRHRFYQRPVIGAACRFWANRSLRTSMATRFIAIGNGIDMLTASRERTAP